MRSGNQRRRGRHRPVRRKRPPWGLIALVLLIGVALIRNGTFELPGPPQPSVASRADSRSQATPAPSTAPSAAAEPNAPQDRQAAPAEPAALPSSEPNRVRIPAIGVDAPLTSLGVDAEGWVESPPAEEKNLAGWFRDAVTPGEQGTAVLVGHVDNKQGPVVFYSLGALKKGQQVEVQRQDGRTAVFETYGVEVFDKDAFPAEKVYGDTGKPELRVITCGGGYSKANGYDSNVVVFAKMVAVR
ncbi:class F sortase [Streptomyces sp. URMC 123]|uniref:class F sortase n=1 Tax=Streptomyces sp. URMC 123 TaxID=3423403 RepID=UPI003F19D7DB